MDITVDLDDDLVRIAKEITGITDISALMHQALRVLVELESARRLALLSVARPAAKKVPRRRKAKH